MLLQLTIIINILFLNLFLKSFIKFIQLLICHLFISTLKSLKALLIASFI